MLVLTISIYVSEFHPSIQFPRSWELWKEKVLRRLWLLEVKIQKWWEDNSWIYQKPRPTKFILMIDESRAPMGPINKPPVYWWNWLMCATHGAFTELLAIPLEVNRSPLPDGRITPTGQGQFPVMGRPEEGWGRTYVRSEQQTSYMAVGRRTRMHGSPSFNIWWIEPQWSWTGYREVMHLTVGSPTALNINFAIDIYKTNLNRRPRSR